MDIHATKLELIKYLLQENKEAVLEKVKKVLLENADQNNIIAYTTDGKSLDLEAYKAKIQKGLLDIEAGRFTTDEDLAKEIETW